MAQHWNGRTQQPPTADRARVVNALERTVTGDEASARSFVDNALTLWREVRAGSSTLAPIDATGEPSATAGAVTSVQDAAKKQSP